MTALYKQGQDRIAILNQRDSDVIIRKGVQIAEKQQVKPKEKKPEGQDTDGHAQRGAEGHVKEIKDDAKEEEVDTTERLAQIWSELRLEENEMLKEKPQIRGKLAKLL